MGALRKVAPMADPFLFLDANRTARRLLKDNSVKRYVTKELFPNEEVNREYEWKLPTPRTPSIVSTIFRGSYVVARILNDGCYVDDGGGGADELFKTMDRCEKENVWGELSELLIPFPVGDGREDATEYSVYKFKNGERSNPVYMHLFPYAAGVTLDTRLKAPPVRRVTQERPALFVLGKLKTEGKNKPAVLVDSKNSIARLYNNNTADEAAIGASLEMLGKPVRVFGDFVEDTTSAAGVLTGIQIEKELGDLDRIMLKEDIKSGKIPKTQKGFVIGLGEVEKPVKDFEPNFEATTIGFGYPDYAPQPRT